MALFQGISAPLLATGVAVCASALGLSAARAGSRVLIPLSGGLLVGAALFGLMPEVGDAIGWASAMALFACGYLVLLVVDRYVSPVCPSCSRGHDHSHCRMELHGFATPMIAATAVHAFLDGWVMTASHAGATLPLAVILHKIPEGIALGAILRVAVPAPVQALLWCVAVESATAVGGYVGLQVAPASRWQSYPMALAGGCFCYLGFHAVHEEWRRRGAWAFAPGLIGVAGAVGLARLF